MAVTPDRAVSDARTPRGRGWISGRLQPRPHGRFDRRRIIGHVVPPLVFAALVLAVWQLYAKLSGVPESSLPAPTQIASALWNDRSLLLSNGWVTLKEILLGYVLSVLLAMGLAVLVVTSRVVERAIYPWLVISQTVPIPAIAPIFVIWTGFDIRPKLMVIVLVTFFPIVVNLIDGLKSTDPELLNLLRTLGAGRWRQFRVARFPASLPFLFSGLKVAAVFAVIGAVFAEWVGSSNGLGVLILNYNNLTATPDMFAAVFCLSLIGITLFCIVAAVERISLPWYHDVRAGEHLGGRGGALTSG
jgi:ABC-type nitrate/sulfonate/bicarbonate transport system permease component